MLLLMNLPKRGAAQLVGKPEGSGYAITTHDGWRVADVDEATPEGRASHIARLIEEARDAGFRQGQAHVREALGLKA